MNNQLKDNFSNKETNKSKKNYKWFYDKKIIGSILLTVIATLQIFAFLSVPFFSTIHGYTIGLLFGWYNPFFYIFIAYIAFNMVFPNKIIIPKWLKMNKYTYWIIIIFITFIGFATSYYHESNQSSLKEVGIKAWNAFNKWFNNFKSGGKYDSWTPWNTNGGIIGVFLYSFFAMIASGMGAWIISITSLSFVVAIIFTLSWLAIFKDISKKKEAIKKYEKYTKEIAINTKNITKEINTSINNNETNKTINDSLKTVNLKETKNINSEKKEKENEEKNIEKNDFPFEDPFQI